MFTLHTYVITWYLSTDECHLQKKRSINQKNKMVMLTSLSAPMRGTTLVSPLILPTKSFGIEELKKTNALQHKEPNHMNRKRIRKDSRVHVMEITAVDILLI